MCLRRFGAGNTAAPWGLLASLSACYYLIGLPTSSSFSGKPSPSSSSSSSGTGDDQRAAPVDYYSSRPTSRWVQGRFESAVLVALLVAGPALLNLALRHRQFSTELLLDTLPLASLPLVFLRLLVARGSLWWTGTRAPCVSCVKDVRERSGRLGSCRRP